MHPWKMLRGALVLILVSCTIGQARAEVELISKADPVPDTNGHSRPLSMSANGRYVVLLSSAPNLAPGQVDRNASDDIFLLDRVAGTWTLLTHSAGSPETAGSASPFNLLTAQISADGRYVAFATGAGDLVPGDENFRTDVFLYDRVTASTTLISHASGETGATANGHSYEPRISGDGEYVVFLSAATNLVAGQTDPGNDDDVFLYHRPSGTLTLVSRKAGSPSTTGDGKSEAAEISGNGRFVAFASKASDLIAGLVDANAGADPETGLETDVFLFEVATGSVSLVSHASGSPLTTANSGSRNPKISADGRWIAFASRGGNLIPGQVRNSNLDAFLFDRISGETRLASHLASSLVTTGGIADEHETSLALSADGRYLAFLSPAPNLVQGQVDRNQRADVFLYDRIAGTTELVSHTPRSRTTATSQPVNADFPGLSADGRYVAFQSAATDLVPRQTDRRGENENDVFLYDRASRANVLVSHTPRSLTTAAGGAFPLISRDGGVVSFLSFATDLGEGQIDPNGFVDVFAYRRATAEVELLTRRDPDLPGVTPPGASLASGLSADGRYVLFTSQGSGLVPGQIDANLTEDVFLRDRVTGKTTLLSRSGSTATGGRSAVLSADGRFAAFLTFTGSVPAGSPLRLYDRIADRSVLVNHALGSTTAPAGSPFDLAISADGRYVAYTCAGQCRLVPGQQPGRRGSGLVDVFLFDRVTGANTLVSHASGSAVTAGNSNSYLPRISANGRYVLFTSQATNLVAGQNSPSHQEQVFVFDRETGAIALASHAAGSPATGSNDDAQGSAISANGRWIVFVSNTGNVVAGQADPDNTFDVFLHDRVSGQTSLVSHAAGSPLAASDGNAFAVSISANGRWIAFESTAANLVAGLADTNGLSDVFLFDRFSGAVTQVSQGGDTSGSPRISADGSHVAYLRSEGGQVSLAVYDRATGASTVAALVHGPIDSDFPLPPLGPWLSSNGREVLFSSLEPLVAGDLNESWDVYLVSHQAGAALEKAAGPFTAVRPCTLLDTRRRKQGPALRSDVLKLVRAHVRKCGIPESSTAVSLKATVFEPTGQGNLRFYRGDRTAPSPHSAILRFQRGRTVSRPVVVPVSEDCNVAVLPFVAGAGETHVLLEVNGYYE